MRGVGRALRETLLTLAALGGAVCIVLVIMAYTGGYSLIMFKTGSMSPTITAGSVALVKETPASEIRVGDVLTVDRAAALPVTHRVTSVEPGSTPAERTITMKGDANDVEDPAPYVIERGRLVVGSVPHLAHVIVWFGSPIVLGGITLGAAALVTWAFWPREPSRRDAERGEKADRNVAALMVSGVLLASASALGGGFAAAPAQAAVPAADDLVMSSDLANTSVHPLSATQPLNWHIDIEAAPAEGVGTLRVATSATGDETLGMRIEVRSCDVSWLATGCGSGERLLAANAPAKLDGTWVSLLQTKTPAATHLRLALTATPEPDATGSERAQLVVRASLGDVTHEVTVDGEDDTGGSGNGSSGGSSGGATNAGGMLPVGELMNTGAGPIGLVLAPIAVLLGLIVAWIGRRRSHAHRFGHARGLR